MPASGRTAKFMKLLYFPGPSKRPFIVTTLTRRRWVAMHLGAIGGGLIAGLTAFSAAVRTNYLPSVPEPLVWLAPTALLSPLLQRASKRYG